MRVRTQELPSNNNKYFESYMAKSSFCQFAKNVLHSFNNLHCKSFSDFLISIGIAIVIEIILA